MNGREQLAKAVVLGHNAAKIWRSRRNQERSDFLVTQIAREWPELFDALERLSKEGDLSQLDRE